jgi:membrane protease YdiL (CAAX protease family)
VLTCTISGRAAPVGRFAASAGRSAGAAVVIQSKLEGPALVEDLRGSWRVEIGDRISGGPAAGPTVDRSIRLRRAYGEILAVYVPSFGLGIISALILLSNPNQQVDQISGPVASLVDIAQYVMQASVTIFGVAYFCQLRGVTLGMLFGRLREPAPYRPAMAAPIYPAQPSLVTPPWGTSAPAPGQPPGYWPGYAYVMPPRPPAERGKGWQFSRAYFISMAGVLGFLISVIVYSALDNSQPGAPSQGNSAYLVPVGLFVALAAGFGEEMLVTGLTVNALERAGIGGKRVWLIYLTAICLRIPFHLYYGWAAFGVIIFTVVNIWVYRRWRLLWPIVLAHATYDFVESLGEVNQNTGGLLLLALGLTTVVMVIVVICIEASDSRSRRRYRRFNDAARAGQAEYAVNQQHAAAPELPPVGSRDDPPPPAGPASSSAA